jgi:hypothetical protein
MSSLAGIDARKSRVVELRFFGGLTVDETAEVLDVSADTVKRDWRLARLWLLRQLKECGLLEQDAVTRRYRPGLLVFELGRLHRTQNDFVALAEQRSVSVARWSDYQTFLSNNFASESGSQGMYSSMYLRVRKSSTTYFFEWSSDGLGWTEITNFVPAITITQVGLGVWAGSSRTVKGYFRFFRQVTNTRLLPVDGQIITI